MVKTVIVDDKLLSYLSSVSKQNTYSIGLILGQSCLDKDYIVHFAKTPSQSEEDKIAGITFENPKSINDFNGNWLAEHAKQTTRMLPGGLYVLGIFIVSPDVDLKPFTSKITSLLQTVHNYLNNNKYLHGTLNSEKLVFHQSSNTLKYFCSNYDVVSHKVELVDVKSFKKKWTNIQCDFDLNKFKYLLKDESDWSLEKHIKEVLDKVAGDLETAVFLFDGEFKDKDDNLETIRKKKFGNIKSNMVQQENENSPPIVVSILQNKYSDSSTDENITYSYGGLKLIGKVSSKLWLQPKLTIGEAAEAMRQDILRSLTSRLEMHWDSLTEEEHLEDINSVHEPPRRVLIALPNSDVALSDYLFPGEGPQEAKISVEEILDIAINGEFNIIDSEGQADVMELDKLYKDSSNIDSTEVVPKIAPLIKYMYVGTIVSFIILLVAILINFI